MDEIKDKLISIERLIQFWKKFRVGESYLQDRNKGEVFNNYTENSADGSYSHAEGNNTTASGNYSHAEGNSAVASGLYSHAEGHSTSSSGISSHAEGYITTASGYYSHTEGNSTIASGNNSHAEGYHTVANKGGAHAEGGYVAATGLYSHAEGLRDSTTFTISGEANSKEYTFGSDSPFTGRTEFVKYVRYNNKIVEITSITTTSLVVKETLSATPLSGAEVYIFGGASGQASHVEGHNSFAAGVASHAEGYNTVANGNYSHAEGSSTTASGYSSHAEGSDTTALRSYSHAEGNSTTASGTYSHAEGSSTTASGNSSHAEGNRTTASKDYSHAEGYYTIASGTSSHAEGHYTTASGNYSHAEGKYNIIDTNNKYAHIIGNGTSISTRSNAHTVDWDGNAWYKGKIYIGGSSQEDGLELTGTTVNYFETANLTTTWNNSAAPFTQVVNIDGILPNDRPIVYVRYSGTYSNDKVYDEELGKVYRVVSGTNQLTFYAHEKTIKTIPISVMVVRQNG